MTYTTSIGVIIPAYQSVRYIGDALQSILAQTMLPREILISDDGSTDGTAECVLSLSRSAPIPVRFVVNQRPAGITQNYLNALRHLSPCDYVAIADHDDIWVPERLQTIHDAFQANQAASLVCSDSYIGDNQLNVTGETIRGGRKRSEQVCFKHMQAGSFASFLKGRLPCLAHTLAFPFSLKHILLSKPSSIHDWYFEEWLTGVAACHGEIVLLPEALTVYRRHAQQVTHVPREKNTNKYIFKFKTSKASLLVDMEKRLQKLLFLQQLLQSTLASTKSGPEVQLDVDSKLINLQKGISFHRTRLKIYSQNVKPMTRLDSVSTLLFSNGYHRYASGFRSAAIDLASILLDIPQLQP